MQKRNDIQYSTHFLCECYNIKFHLIYNYRHTDSILNTTPRLNFFFIHKKKLLVLFRLPFCDGFTIEELLLPLRDFVSTSTTDNLFKGVIKL